MTNTMDSLSWGLKLSDDLMWAETALAETKERLRIVLEAKEWWEAELFLQEEVLAAKNAEERKARHTVARNKDGRMGEIRTSEHVRRQEVANAESEVNRLTREFRLNLARVSLEEARLRLQTAGIAVLEH